MRDPDRIHPTLTLLGEIWEQNPDMRLGQLLVNALRPTSPMPEMFYVEDEKLVAGLKEFAQRTGRSRGDRTRDE